MYSLQYEYYKLLFLKFCMCTLNNLESTFFYHCSLSFLPQKFELFVIVITDINHLLNKRHFYETLFGVFEGHCFFI